MAPMLIAEQDCPLSDNNRTQSKEDKGMHGVYILHHLFLKKVDHDRDIKLDTI